MKKIILFSFLFFAFYFNVRAAHLDLYKIDGVYSSQYNIDTGSYFSSNQKKYVIDGKVVYCVEPGMNIMTREYSSFDLSYSNFSDDILNKISLIGYFGYDYPGHSSDRYFMAAQELIWEMIGNNEVHFTTGINDSGNAIDIEYEKNEIMDLVNDYYLKPSFDLNSYDGRVGEKIVLSDQNHVLSDYDVISTGAYIDGDNLIIDVLDEGIRDIKLVRKKYDNLNSVFYQESGSQDFMFLRPDFDVESIVSINGYIPYSSVSIYKTGDVLVDYTDDFVYEERGLDNISFGSYSDEDIYVNGTLIYNVDDLVDELVTVDGYASSINIPNGKYYLRELDTYDYLIISDDIHFEINNINNYIYKYDLEIKNDKKNVSVSINKNGEVFDDLDNSHYEPLEGVKFGLYSHDDIYSYDNELLISKDSLIHEYVTDSDGSIYIDNLPISSYYFKELETYEYYVFIINSLMI